MAGQQKEKTLGTAKKLAALEARRRQLLAKLGRTGLVLQGTITRRTIRRPAPEQPAREQRYGPYYQWTFKRAGRTVTVNLTTAQARLFQQAIREQRRLEKTMIALRLLSRKILELTTVSVARRKPCNSN